MQVRLNRPAAQSVPKGTLLALPPKESQPPAGALAAGKPETELPRFGAYARPLLKTAKTPLFGSRVPYPILINQLDREDGGLELQRQRDEHPDLVQLNELRKEVMRIVRDAGLDPLDTKFYAVPEETFLKLAARNGFLNRYPHWSWGQEYFNLKLPRLYGKKDFREVVVPNDPTHAYLPDTDPQYAQKILILHALARADIYKNNLYFKRHNSLRNIDEFADHAKLVRDRADQVANRVSESADHSFLEHLSRVSGVSTRSVEAYLSSRSNPRTLGEEIQNNLASATTELLTSLHLDQPTLKQYLTGELSVQKLGTATASRLEEGLNDMAAQSGMEPNRLKDYLKGTVQMQFLGSDAAGRINTGISALSKETGIDQERLRNFLTGQTSAEAIGNETVEEFLDQAHSVRSLINIAQGARPFSSLRVPSATRPEADVLGYIIRHGQGLQPWQRDMIEVIRRESYALLPQTKTQILADGWACLINEKLNTKNPWLWDRPNITREAVWNAQVHRNNPVQVNTYELGYVMFQEAEKKLREKYTDDPQREEKVKRDLLKIRSENYDVSFLRQFLTKDVAIELARRGHPLYNFGPDEAGRGGQQTGTKLFIQDDEFNEIRERLIETYSNAGQPLIQVINGNYRGHGELLLKHAYTYDLKRDYAEQTVINLARLWGKRVFLQTWETKDNGETKPLLLSSDGRSIVSRNVVADPQEGE